MAGSKVFRRFEHHCRDVHGEPIRLRCQESPGSGDLYVEAVAVGLPPDRFYGLQMAGSLAFVDGLWFVRVDDLGWPEDVLRAACRSLGRSSREAGHYIVDLEPTEALR